MFWCSLVGADRRPKEAMPVARQKYLGFGVLCWERKVIRAEKLADGRVPLPRKQGAGESLFWLIFVALSADPAPQNHVSNL